jgi:hypothetical protein
MTDKLEVPYEKQLNPWSCGAAALAMVYRSLGVPGGQADIWERIASPGHRYPHVSRAQAMAADALSRGLSAVLIEVRDPWRVLERGLQSPVRLIANHGADRQSGLGHYSVVVGLDAEHVVLHDPGHGPNRRLTRSEFLELWNPAALDREIPNQILLAIAGAPSVGEPCPLCGGTGVERWPCPMCRRSVPLQPGVVLGCLTDTCPMRAWEEIYCPFCECHWDTGLGARRPG